MKHTKYILVALICTSVFLTGCSEQEPVIDTTDYTKISTETANTGIYPETDEDGNIALSEDYGSPIYELTDNTFYVAHTCKDGDLSYEVLYPLYSYYDDGVMSFMLTPSSDGETVSLNERNMPTLFLQNGDRLLFYSETALLDYVNIYHYEDLGYTVGIYNISNLTNNRCYLKNKESSHVVAGITELDYLQNLACDGILLDNFGLIDNPNRTPLTLENTKNGIITGVTRDKLYALDIYGGTVYQLQTLFGNVHAYKYAEGINNPDYIALQQYLFEIVLPDNLPQGVYAFDYNNENNPEKNDNLKSFMRLCVEPTYSESETYNTKIFPDCISGMYSTNKALSTNKLRLTLEDYERYNNSKEQEKYYYVVNMTQDSFWYRTADYDYQNYSRIYENIPVSNIALIKYPDEKGIIRKYDLPDDTKLVSIIDEKANHISLDFDETAFYYLLECDTPAIETCYTVSEGGVLVNAY